MVTAHGRERVLHSAESAGIDALLLKPIAPSLSPCCRPRRIVVDILACSVQPVVLDSGDVLGVRSLGISSSC